MSSFTLTLTLTQAHTELTPSLRGSRADLRGFPRKLARLPAMVEGFGSGGPFDAMAATQRNGNKRSTKCRNDNPFLFRSTQATLLKQHNGNALQKQSASRHSPFPRNTSPPTSIGTHCPSPKLNAKFQPLWYPKILKYSFRHTLLFLLFSQLPLLTPA